ncbi:FecR domain-containing protein [Reichenbachiella sp. MALMAid0571]|uniref:FecR family protein n=1 Tax=Reichenbachiella sp. MALMAid0571 TaxID=3143939 RepID=UPI0032DEE284
MKYDAYSTEDFLKDEFFVKSVLNPNYETDHFWKSWTDNHPNKMEEFTRAQQLVRSLEYETMEKPVQEDYVRVFENVLKYNKKLPQQNNKHFFGRDWSSWKGMSKIAASVAMLLLAGWLWYGNGLNNLLPSEFENSTLVTKVSPYGQKTTVKLPDGTMVVLNSGSTLKYKKEFDDSFRKVELTGEAIFDVVKDPARPFTVHSGTLSTTVLGTFFNVRAYNDESQIRVSLAKGKVVVNNTGQTNQLNNYYLEPGQEVTYHKVKKTIEKRKFDIDQVFAWNKGIIVFESVRMKTVLKELERWYGVSFKVTGESQEWNYTGKFEKQSLENVLRNLSFSQRFEFTIENKEVEIKF